MIFFTVLFLGTLYTKPSHGILQPCKLANERFADAVSMSFAVPCPLPGASGRFPFRRGLRGFYVVRQAGHCDEPKGVSYVRWG